MEIVVTGRHVQVSERFRRHLDEKLAKVPQLAPRVQRLDVVVTHEANKRQSKACDRVEITCHVKGPVVRAEAIADDKYGALDIAMDKLLERLRRDHDIEPLHTRRELWNLGQLLVQVSAETLRNLDVPSSDDDLHGSPP